MKKFLLFLFVLAPAILLFARCEKEKEVLPPFEDSIYQTFTVKISGPFNPYKMGLRSRFFIEVWGVDEKSPTGFIHLKDLNWIVYDPVVITNIDPLSHISFMSADSICYEACVIFKGEEARFIFGRHLRIKFECDLVVFPTNPNGNFYTEKLECYPIIEPADYHEVRAGEMHFTFNTVIPGKK